MQIHCFFNHLYSDSSSKNENSAFINSHNLLTHMFFQTLLKPIMKIFLMKPFQSPFHQNCQTVWLLHIRNRLNLLRLIELLFTNRHWTMHKHRAKSTFNMVNGSIIVIAWCTGTNCIGSCISSKHVWAFVHHIWWTSCMCIVASSLDPVIRGAH